MKALLIVGALFFVSLSTIATPYNVNSTKVVVKEMPDLSQDKNFIKAVIELYTIQARVIETNSSNLMRKAANNTLTEEEKNSLAKNLGYSDYTTFNNSFENLGNSILSLKNKYSELNNEATASVLLNNSVNKLAQEGTVTIKSTPIGVCFWQLLCSIFSCVHTSCSWAELRECLCEAYADYKACNTPR